MDNLALLLISNQVFVKPKLNTLKTRCIAKNVRLQIAMPVLGSA